MISQRSARLAGSQPAQRGSFLFSRLACQGSLNGFSLTLVQRDMLVERALMCWEVQKPLKYWVGGKPKGHQARPGILLHENRKAGEKIFFFTLVHFLSQKHLFSHLYEALHVNGGLELHCREVFYWALLM